MSSLKMPNVNRVMIAGHLTADPQCREVGPNHLTSMRVAVTKKWKDKTSGELKEKTTFVDVDAWKQPWLAKLKKGYPVLVEGELNEGTWQDKETGREHSKIKITSTRVQQLDWDNAKGEEASKSESRTKRQAPEPEYDDDTPF